MLASGEKWKSLHLTRTRRALLHFGAVPLLWTDFWVLKLNSDLVSQWTESVPPQPPQSSRFNISPLAHTAPADAVPEKGDTFEKGEREKKQMPVKVWKNEAFLVTLGTFVLRLGAFGSARRHPAWRLWADRAALQD